MNHRTNITLECFSSNVIDSPAVTILYRGVTHISTPVYDIISYLGSVAIRLGQKIVGFLDKRVTSGEIVGVSSAGWVWIWLSWIHHQVPIPIMGSLVG